MTALERARQKTWWDIVLYACRTPKSKRVAHLKDADKWIEHGTTKS